MKHYEVLFILKPTLTEEEVSAKLDFVKEVLVKNGAQIESVVEMGTRKLAYKIKKYERGTYFVIYFKAPTNLISELERVLRITEEIIRFLIVKYENKKEIAAWEKLSKGIKQQKKEVKANENIEG
ncbi:30S ribosomal protein S6 [Campylobacter insulaenigrae]|uniref:Small ribosomal subunit protein bS6 n=2 Tax=Campylobacter insulaenigrae TaxID=260714 RepID=A0A0A8H1M2_9BACT|nr:30S ribosomal protein S6 [Campylobacter insulaenigrae]AJC87882.1 30S ribosomal protein S6 [Campylobacter insulaenigrae NCTC 12927]MCR6570335.1 30S ribosomal protein S6 [Campylobacter insulaenigrae]MCR6571737.1 30S ribosomal protein S6 [Campylobacter insulaenigrae]MCR6573374.1 30S ribosomal protein S6 [Campylobacter insulaenigrae]MCR6574839.1 30S ribosomal protein S6 [Campylobacter insulaenigrae]